MKFYCGIDLSKSEQQLEATRVLGLRATRFAKLIGSIAMKNR